MAAKVVVVARTSVSDAPLGEPFRVLTRESAEKVSVTLDDMFSPRLLGALFLAGISGWIMFSTAILAWTIIDCCHCKK